MRAIACSELSVPMTPGGYDKIAPAFQQCSPVPVEMGDQLGGGEHGIAAQPARHGAGMPGFADTFDHAMANIAANAGHDPDRQVARHQHRALLDVQFQPGRDAARRRAVARPCAMRSTSAPTLRMQSINGRPVTACGAARSSARQPAEQRARPDIGLAEPGAFLAAQAVELQGPARLESARVSSEASTASPATTPAPPSKLPPCGTESRCDPQARNGRSGSVPASVTTRLAPASRSVASPSFARRRLDDVERGGFTCPIALPGDADTVKGRDRCSDSNRSWQNLASIAAIQRRIWHRHASHCGGATQARSGSSASSLTTAPIRSVARAISRRSQNFARPSMMVDHGGGLDEGGGADLYGGGAGQHVFDGILGRRDAAASDDRKFYRPGALIDLPQHDRLDRPGPTGRP